MKKISQCERFRRDMKKAGFKVHEYKGRFLWQGPAVYTNEKVGPTLQDVHRATKVKLQRDNLAFDWVVYPVEPESYHKGPGRDA